jgi:hypothetical protein
MFHHLRVIVKMWIFYHLCVIVREWNNPASRRHPVANLSLTVPVIHLEVFHCGSVQEDDDSRVLGTFDTDDKHHGQCVALLQPERLLTLQGIL